MAMALDSNRDASSQLKGLVGHLGADSPVARFAELLYAGAGLEGFTDTDLEGLAADTRDVMEFVAEKPAHRHKIRIRPSGLFDTTQIEILNDDMPFLVDSVMAEIQARHFAVKLVVHPIFKTSRDGEGRLKAILGPADQNWSDGRQESVIVIHVDGLSPEVANDVGRSLAEILSEVRVSVTDWPAMVGQVDVAIRTLEAATLQIADDLKAESLAFLRWMRDGHFVFLGLSDMRLIGGAAEGTLDSVDGSGLGLLRDPHVAILSRGGDALAMTAEVRRQLLAPSPLTIAKASLMSRVHRRTFLDYIAIKNYGKGSEPTGELRIVGLFTSQAYTQTASAIPFLRHKIETVLAGSGYPPQSHAGKSLINVLDTFPRDELFQIGVKDLAEWSEGILDLEMRPRVRVFSRLDRFGRFASILLYAPRDRWTTDVRERVGALLAEAYQGRVASYHLNFPDGPLMRAHFLVTRDGDWPNVDPVDLERLVTSTIRTWDDHLANGMKAFAAEAPHMAARYANAFPPAYSETIDPVRAIEDMRRIERLASSDQPVAIDFYRGRDDKPNRIHAAMYRFGEAIRLSERVPALENLGFSVIDERSHRLTPTFDKAVREVALHDMLLESADGAPLELGTHDQRLEEAYVAVYRQAAENDLFNRLVLAAGADWREAALLRAYASYLRQLGVPFGLSYLAETIVRHAGVARDLIELFHVRFDPDRKLNPSDKSTEAAVRLRITGALAQVPSLDEDRILRLMVNLVDTTVRTNFYQRDASNHPPEVIALKFDSKAVEASPQPRPFREIWVYSPRVEGVHLRFAPIARGGIRWSDRAQDFRTEVLGLVRAQLVKNAVIVPSGAKGGFLPKQMPRAGSRDEIMKEGIAAYRLFISALLDITDNLVDGKIVPPKRVVRRDGDDPYLVVAADKGTATFSDFANEISACHGHWLGDAFASGGSAGYDHKKMAITARGAWECVKRHFREMDWDIQRKAFRVIGVGDMSGDVFGNGMLLSPVTRLVAAFDHRDIFIDPEPNEAVSFTERERLFEMPRSSWQDYDKAKISRGGGVFSRSLKSIPLTDEMRTLFKLEGETCNPAELIRGILKCDVDLVWFGGIGTYVRASAETDEQVGDRATDALRVTAAELGAKVVGEGANLGLTQKARIELAQRGVRLNTDSIDNSAGVNSSDIEVNIKIALGGVTRSGKLKPDDRKAFLASMTDDVASGCLLNNYQQSLALSLAEARSSGDTGDLAQLMRALEAHKLLNRRIESLPSDAELSARLTAGKPLTRPELAVLLSYAKIALTEDLLASRVPDSAAAASLLTAYFPKRLTQEYGAEVNAHRLKREIVATALTNAVINRSGLATPVRLAEESGRSTADVATAYLIVERGFDLPSMWHRIQALDNRTAGRLQLDLELAVQRLLVGQMAQMLRDGEGLSEIDDTVGLLSRGVAAVRSGLTGGSLSSQWQQLTSQLTAQGVPADLASDLAALPLFAEAPLISRLSGETRADLGNAARVYFGIGEFFRLGDLKLKAAALPVTDPFDRQAIAVAVNQLTAAQAAFVKSALEASDFTLSQQPQAWLSTHKDRLAGAKTMLERIATEPAVTVSRLTVAAAQLRDLAEAVLAMKGASRPTKA
jgi:glutamate dehydrogenase